MRFPEDPQGAMGALLWAPLDKRGKPVYNTNIPTLYIGCTIKLRRSVYGRHLHIC